MSKNYFFILPLLLIFSCQSKAGQEKPAAVQHQNEIIPAKAQVTPTPVIFGRDTIIAELKNKIKNNTSLIIHVFVPLCDNKNQGIVPVNASLGNGMSLTANLYWGAAYGVKNYFKKSSDWKFLKSELNIDSNVLERVIFIKNFSNGAKVYMIADAYRGDRMKECLNDYFNSIAGKRTRSVTAGEKDLSIAGAADLIVFNGHNGLMDTDVFIPNDIDKSKKDACVIACASQGYFKEPLLQAGAYPLITTTNFMAPEAYVLEAIVNSWSDLKSPAEIRAAAGAAYHKYQKCGLNGATKLFKAGW